MKKSEKNQQKLATNPYNPAAFEPKWQSKWENDGIYHPDLDSANGSASSPLGPFYNLMMFPYPSAEGMHAGNFFTFTGADTFGRFKRMQGYDVFEPIGLDGFGIHSENYAIKVGSHPVEQSEKSEENFYRQFRATGNMFDWTRTVETYKKDYYKWTQWVFTELFKAGLAYRKKSPVNFCPSCATVLADEQVIDTKCERCGSIVVKKNMEQWFFRITNYADRLLDNIEKLDWTEKVKIAQRNWIGKKDGISIKYKVLSSKYEIEVFTTRPDTNFGATFIALAPEHPLVAEILKQVQDDKKREIESYIEKTKNKTEIERQAEGKEKTGVFTGFYASNQLTGYKMPVWISDFVLIGFGTGAVVGVPGHDKRDFEFAKKFDLEIMRVVVGADGDSSDITKIEQVQEEEGTMINSDFLNGLDIHKATERIMDFLEEKGFGKRKTTYHLRDWLISRQRYWGPPIPMIYCEACAAGGSGDRDEMPGWYVVPEKDLPVELPYIEDFKPLGSAGQNSKGEIVTSPLANHPEFYTVKCPHCFKPAKRETDVSDTFLDSAWYFFRYTSTEFADKPFDEERVKKWLPVKMYIGGAEHSVLHLLYARFITMVFKDLGFIDFEEPFAKFYAHGLIIKEGAKMSKSKGNIINPDEYIKKYGADTLRMYLRFLAPFNQDGDFRDSGIDGMNKFLKRVWKLMSGVVSDSKSQNPAEQNPTSPRLRGAGAEPRSLRAMHQAIKDVTVEMEALRFNTAIAHLMTWYNFLAKQEVVSREEAEVYLKLLAPFAPHMTEELYQNVILSVSEGSSRDSSAKPQNDKKFESIHMSPWPVYDEKYLVADTVKIPVQVNGKLRSMLEVSSSDISDKARVEEMARKDAKTAKFLDGQTVKQAIYIPGKVLNFVV
jgi:leucyl-tRNA synthetase